MPTQPGVARMYNDAEANMVDLCRRVTDNDVSALKRLVAWSAVQCHNWLEGQGTILPPHLENLLGIVWAHALQRGVSDLRRRKITDNHQAVAFMSQTVSTAAEEVRRDLEDKVLRAQADRITASIHAHARRPDDLDGMRQAGIG